MFMDKLSKHQTKAYLCLVFILFLTLVWRSHIVPITQDESISFFEFMLDFPDRIFYIPSANNHLLNTLLASACISLIGESTLALRLPNVLSFLIYAFSIWKIFELQSNLTKWLGIISLLFCLNVFEYFGLARGYGLSISLLLFHIYATSRFLPTGSIKWLVLSLGSIVLAAAASFTLLPQVLISITFITANLIFWKRIKYCHFGVLIPFLALFFWLLQMALNLSKKGEIYLGNKSNVWAGLFEPLFNYLRFNFDHSVFLSSLIIFTLFILIAFVNMIRKPKIWFSSLFAFTSLIIFGNVLISSVLAEFLGINYPFERAALYLLPIALISYFIIPVSGKVTKYVVVFHFLFGVILSGRFLIDFSNNFQLEGTRIEPENNLPSKIIERLATISDSTSNARIIRVSDQYTDVFRYYNFYLFHHLFSANKQSEAGTADYHLTNQTVLENLNLVLRSGDSYLYANPDFNRQLVDELPFFNEANDFSQLEFVGIFRDSLDLGSDQFIELAFKVSTKECARYAMVMQLDEDNKTIYSKHFRLDELLLQKEAFYVKYWPVPSNRRVKVKLFLSNIDKELVQLEVNSLKLLTNK